MEDAPGRIDAQADMPRPMKQIEAKRPLIRVYPGLTDARDFVIAHQSRDVRGGNIEQFANQSCFNNEGFVDDVYVHHRDPDARIRPLTARAKEAL